MTSTEIKIQVPDIRCASCADKIEKKLRQNKLVKEVSVSVLDKTVLIKGDLEFEAVRSLLSEIGYSAIQKPLQRKPLETLWTTRFIVATASMLIVVTLGMLYHHGPPLAVILIEFVGTVLLTIIYRETLVSGIKRLFLFQFDMTVLISVACFSAWMISLFSLSGFGNAGYYFEAIAVTLFAVHLGKEIENRLVLSGRQSLQKLSEWVPENVMRLLPEGKSEKVSIKDIAPGDFIWVEVGERVGVDGVVDSAGATIDNSMLTGESKPEKLEVGDFVFAGSLVLENGIKTHATQTFQSSRVAKMLGHAETVLSNKNQAQRIADKIAAWFTPTVFVLAIISFIVWWFIRDFQMGLQVFLSVILVACPCAIGLAAPIAFVVAVNKCTQKGLILRNPLCLEKVRQINTLILDKTGTLTKAMAEVIDVVVLENENMFWKVASALSGHSRHPLSKAVFDHCDKKELELTDIRVQAGTGISAFFKGQLFRLGKLDDKDAKYRDHDFSVVGIYDVDKLMGFFKLEDTVREDAPELIHKLKEQNIRIILASGDLKNIVRKTAEHLGIDEYFAEQSPLEKFNLVEKLQREGACVGAIGDGVNDALMLSKSDLSFSMGSGTDIAKEVSDVVVQNGQLTSVVDFMFLSHGLFKLIRQNYFLAFIFNASAIPLAMLGFLSPALSSVLMSLSSIGVVTHSLLKRYPLTSGQNSLSSKIRPVSKTS